MSTNLPIIERIYHTKNLGIHKETIRVPNKISDHPIIIFNTTLPIPLKKEIKAITIIDQAITTRNHSEIYKLIESNIIPTFQDPRKTRQINTHQLSMDNENYFQNFEQLKELNKQKFHELKNKNSQN